MPHQEHPQTSRQQRRRASRSGGPAPRRSVPPFVAGFGVAAVAAIVLWWFQGSGGGGDVVVRDGAPSWSPDGREVAFYSEVDGKADLVVADRAGGSRRALTRTPAVDEGGPAWSPDGRSIAFDSDRAGNFEIWVMQADGGNPRRLTNHPARDVSPAWSPDGRHIVFMSARENAEFDIYRMNADGSNVERLTTGSSNWFPQYSPDSTRLALHVMRDVHLLDLQTRQLRRLTQDPQNGMHPAWSPDGQSIAFMSWRNGRTEIFRMQADGSGQERLISMPAGDAVDPRWSPAGDAIAFVHVPAGGLGDKQMAGQERIVYVYDLATGALTRLSR